MRPGRPSLRQLQAMVNKFNATYPVGTPVMLRTDKGEVLTEVVYPAELLGGHSAVAGFKDVSGKYSIEDDRVRQCLEPVA